MKKIIASLLLCLLAACLTGCQKNTAPAVDNGAAVESAESKLSNELKDYLAAIEAQSNAIKTSLENDALTQTEMNQKSGELCDLWDAAMNRMLDAAKQVLPAADMEKLTAEQNAWLETRKNAAEAAGKELEGGSMYALIVNSEMTKLTEARVYELYALLK